MLNAKWFWATLPAGMAYGGISVLIPLFILGPYIDGDVVDVALVVSAGNFAMIPASLVWGFIIDLFNRRRLYVLISFWGRCLLCLALYFVNNLVAITILYSLFIFIAMASGPSLNLLLMETHPKSTWSKAYVNLMRISQIGIFSGIFIGTFWSMSYSLRDYFLFLSILSFPSIPLTYLWIKDPEITLERRGIVKIMPSLFHRLQTNPLLFLHLPRLSDLQRLYRILNFGMTHYLPLIYISTFLFFIANSIFFTTFTPFLKSRGLSDSLVFGIYTIESISNIFTPLIGLKYAERDKEDKAVIIGAGGRTVLSLAISMVALTGFGVVPTTIVAYFLLSVTYGLFFGPITTLLLKNLPSSKKGELLGLFSAQNGLSLFIGSLISGYIVISIGYPSTFLIVTMIYAVSTLLMGRFKYAIH